jgi:putative two-component system response regulator
MIKKINSLRFAKLVINLKDQLEEIKNIKNTTIFSLAKLAESRDPETGAHLERIREYAKVLATEMADNKKFSPWINNEFIYNIYNMSVLHDIGKVGIPDKILLKPEKLTDEEYTIMKTHTTIGGKALEAAVKLNRNSAFLEVGKEIAYHHHERWDGNGYPDGLKEDDIPLVARITAFADVYDAVGFKRVYRNYAMKEGEIDEMLKQECGKLFDPDIYRVYLGIRDRFLAIKMILS